MSSLNPHGNKITVVDCKIKEIEIPEDAQYFRVVMNSIEFVKWDYYWYLWIGGDRWCITMWNRHEIPNDFKDIYQLTQKPRTQEMFGG